MISVLIASAGRSELRDTLESVEKATLPEGQTLEVVIADDSSDGRVSALVADFQSALAIRVVPVHAANVALARNACLDAAKGEWLIFVDDDETVAIDWLEGHLSAAKTHKADAVFGPVHPVYPKGTAKWFVTADPLFADWGWREEGRVSPNGRTGNTLIRRDALGDLRFDAAFGKSGGEDHEFFRRFAALGNRMVVTNMAKAYETIPPHRATLQYLWARSTRGGHIYARVELGETRGLPAFKLAAEAGIKIVAFALMALVALPFGIRRAVKLAMRSAANWGKLHGALGVALPTSWT